MRTISETIINYKIKFLLEQKLDKTVWKVILIMHVYCNCKPRKLKTRRSRNISIISN